jgi:hypothetical protein
MRPPDVEVFVPCTIKSEANSRDHWATKAKRVKAQRQLAKLWVHGRICEFTRRENIRASELHKRDVIVQLHVTRSRRLDDDNLTSGLKAIRDGVADALGRNDGATSGLRFALSSQSTSRDKRQHGVLVSVWIASGPTVAP